MILYFAGTGNSKFVADYLAEQMQDGKIVPEDLEQFLNAFYQDENHEHMVFPGMVYISHPTEYGTLYSKKELEELSRICQFYLESPTNQQFVILDNQQMERLKEQVVFSFWEQLDEEHTVVRFATSWSTTEEDLGQLEKIL